MSFRIVVVASLSLAIIGGGECFGRLLMGMDAVAWENSNDQGPLLFREVPEANLVSVRAKISAQTAGLWSQAGVIVRAPNPIDAAAGQENWQTSWSFRAPAAGPFQHQSNAVTLGAEAEVNDGGLSAAALQYMRLDRIGPGQFQAFRGSGPNDASITWTPHDDGPQTNANLAGINLQVGAAAGAIGALANAQVAFDWIEIMTTTQTYRDDFTYTHDFTAGVPGFNPGATTGGAIWQGVENAAAGGTNTISNPRAGECIMCVWAEDDSDDFNDGSNWGTLIAPNGNDVTVSFGAAFDETPGTVFNNKNVTVKRIEFNNATNGYALGGPGSFTLDADTGSASIEVLAGSHEIQTELILNDNVTATAAAGTTLNINAAVFLNGRTFTTGGAGVINLNNGSFPGGAPGGGAVVNEGNLAGLAAVGGSFYQAPGAMLAVEVGGAPIQIAGTAELAGALDVSLADGFSPSPGSIYQVLTADGVTDLGLSLVGADAGLFRLLVDGGSVSLIAGSIPEPSTFLLISGGVLAVFGVRRRRAQRCETRRQPNQKRGAMLRCRTAVAFLFALFVIGASSAQAQFGTFRDDFGNDLNPNAAQHNYRTGTVPVGGIWTGVHNPTFGDDGTVTPAAIFAADSFDANGGSKAGKLFIEDLNTHPNTTAGVLGVGWEAGINNAPMLYREIPADSKFTATVKIDAQQSGNWSYAPIVARLKAPAGGPNIPVGFGRGDTLDPNENFVTMGSFRTNTADNLAATLLTQGVVNGGGVGDINTGGAVGNGLPLWVRMEKIGAQFRSLTSTDGTTFTERNTLIQGELNSPGEIIQVGPSMMMFTTDGGSAGYGFVDYDFFEITVEPNPILTMANWVGNAGTQGSGDWGNGNNWMADLPGVEVSANTVNVTLGASALVTGPTTVFTNAPRTMKSLTFNSANKYAIAWHGAINMAADVGTPAINVIAGSHEVQVDVSLGAPTNITAAAGTRLDFNNQFDFVAAGRTVNVTGPGRVNFNNNIDLAVDGVVNVNSTGVVGGSGRINGRLNNNTGGTVAPGTSAGTLTVTGIYAQAAGSSLAMEIGGTAAGTFDKLAVLGTALLNGTLNVSLINGFIPAPTDTFQILTAANLAINTRFTNTTPAPANLLTIPGGTFNVNYTYGVNGFVTLTNFTPGGVPGDYNGNGTVDAADYVLWRNGGPLQNDPSPGVQPGDYDFWKARLGNTAGSSSGGAAALGAVPEPGSIVLLLIAAIPGIGLASRHKHFSAVV